MHDTPVATAPAPARSRLPDLRRVPWFRRLKLLGRRMIGRDPWLAVEPVAGLRQIDDWACLPAALQPGDRVWAFGVGTDVDFELTLHAGHGVAMDLFDPSPVATGCRLAWHSATGREFAFVRGA